MDRRACADLPALPLQILLAAHPEWKDLPVAVVDLDEPRGVLLWVNERARRRQLRPGMRYAAALALERNLRAGVVPAAEVERTVAGLGSMLRTHTPHVEPSREEAGVFWLDANGLERLYVGVEAWARVVAATLRSAGFTARLVVAFSRFGTWALAKGLADLASSRRARARDVLLCESGDEERRLVRGVALDRLGLDPVLSAALTRLGVHTVGEFLDLPAGGIRRRFGEDAWRLHRRARGETWDPLLAQPAVEPLLRSLLLEDPVADTSILLFLVRRLLASLLETLAPRGEAVVALHVRLFPSLRREKAPLAFVVRTAEPTLDEAVILDLVRLALEAELRKPGGAGPHRARETIVEVEVEAEARAATVEQRRLFPGRSRRDLAAGARALARLVAELGEGSVVRAVLRQGHLPEAAHGWEPAVEVKVPAPRTVRLRPVVRRIEHHALALPPRPFRERDDCWISTPGTGHGRVESMVGPYIVSGGWWNREVHREYHYARTESGEILWVYYDRGKRRWFLAGNVE